MSSERQVRRLLGTAVALCSLVALPALAAAENGPVVPPAAVATGPGPVTGELAHFGVFLDQHPFVEMRLRENTAILNNPAFLRNHPLVEQFLARHPGLAAEVAARPRWFVHRELARQAGAPLTREQLTEFDRWLDQRPGLEKQLLQHPGLLRQPEFVHNHPELHEYLKRHPGFDHSGEAKPERPLKSERRN